MVSFSIRWLEPDDVDAFRAIRLESIELYPQAFGAYSCDESDQSLDFFANMIQPHSILGTFDSATNQLLGVLGFRLNVGHKMKHKGTLWGFYVRSDFQRQGIGRALMQHLFKCLPELFAEVEQVDLRVESSNEPLKKFYKEMGFEFYGTEPRSVKMGDSYFDKDFMVKFL